MKTLSLVLTLALFASLGLARPIHWSSDLFALNLTSEDARMTADYRFELGVFRDGFIPTADNMDQWAEFWAPAQRVTYHSGNDWFTGRHVVADNTPPFRLNTRAYIWGFSGDSVEGEWILLRASNWFWPVANKLNAAPLQWDVANANQVIIGDLGTGTAFQLRTARVRDITAPATAYAQWLAETGATRDRDSLVTFFTGGRKPLLSVLPDHTNPQGRGVVIALNRLADRTGVLEIQYSTDLITWHSAGGRLAILENTPAGRRLLPDEELAQESRLFFRTVLSE